MNKQKVKIAFFMCYWLKLLLKIYTQDPENLIYDNRSYRYAKYASRQIKNFVLS